MKTVAVKKSVLLKTLKLNRLTHVEMYEIAVENYKKALVDELKDMLNEAIQGNDVNHRIDLTKPTSNVKEYDRVIAMLEMSVDSKITLDEGDFNQFVLDDWGWKNNFLVSNSAYFTGTKYDNVKF